jgi:hypothetical protein
MDYQDDLIERIIQEQVSYSQDPEYATDLLFSEIDRVFPEAENDDRYTEDTRGLRDAFDGAFRDFSRNGEFSDGKLDRIICEAQKLLERI